MQPWSYWMGHLVPTSHVSLSDQEPSLGVRLWSSKPSRSWTPPDLITSHHRSKSAKWDSSRVGQRGPDDSAGSVCSSALPPGSPKSLTQRQAALFEAPSSRAGACLKALPGTSPERGAPCSSAAVSTHVSMVYIWWQDREAVVTPCGCESLYSVWAPRG